MNFFSSFLQHKKLALVAIALLAPISAHADDGDYDGSAQMLGWISIGSGLVANLSLMAFNAIKKFPLLKVGMGSEISKIGTAYKPMLNFHILLNSVGFVAGMSHGLLLFNGLDSISLSLAIVMTVSMISGIILKIASDRHLKLFGRLVHGQAILSILLVSLVVLHIITVGGDVD